MKNTLPGERTPPLRQYPMFRSSDLDDAHERIAKNISPHHIHVMGDSDQLDVNFCGVHLEDITLLKVGYGAKVEVSPESEEYYFLQTTIEGCGEVIQGKEHCSTRAGDTVVVSPSTAYRMRLEQHCTRLAIGFRANALRDRLSQLLCTEVKSDLRFDFSIGNNEIWNSTLQFVIQQLASAPKLFDSPTTRKVYSDLLLSTLLEIQHHNYAQSEFDKPDMMVSSEVKKAIEYIQQHVKTPISVADLADHCNVSSRTLQRNFVKHMNQTPSVYIRNEKLSAIHRQLRQTNPIEKGIITRILLDYGVMDFGRFSRYYFKKFGCTPSETLRRQ